VTNAAGSTWGSTAWLVGSSPVGTYTCVATSTSHGTGSSQESVPWTIPALTPGTTYSAYFIAYSDTGCLTNPSTTWVFQAPGQGVTIDARPADHVAFTTQPASSTSTVAFPTQPVVKVQDSTGATVTTDTSTVTLSIGTNPGVGTLTCTGGLTKAAVAGVATFSGCAIDKAGTGYVLHATDGVLTPGDSAAFDITAGGPAKLVATPAPTSPAAGAPFSLTFQSQDAGGNPSNLTQATTVTLSVTTGTSTQTSTASDQPAKTSTTQW